MTSLFAELEQLVSDAVDEVYGEAVRINRYVKGEEFGRTADSSRQAKEVTAVVDFNPITATAKDEGTYDGFQPTVAADRIHVSIATSAFLAACEWPAEADTITLLKRPGMPEIRLAGQPQYDGIGRIICVCTKS